MSSQAARLAAARRQRAYRRRQATGDVILEVEVRVDDIAAALVAVGWLSPIEALDRDAVSHAVAEMLRDWSAAWVMRHSC